MDSLSPFTLARPASAGEAVVLASAHPGARFLAGGTDLLPNLRRGLGEPGRLIDLSHIAGFAAIAREGEGWRLGAGLTLARIAADATLAAALPALAQAAATVAGPAHRTVATLGGNLCQDTRCVHYNQSAWWRAANGGCLKHDGDVCHVAPQGTRCHAAYSGDLAPALIVLDAQAELVGTRGTRRLPLAELYRDDGAQALALEPGELLAAVHVPAQPPGTRSAYRKSRVRGAIDFPLAGVAMRVCTDGAGGLADLRVALTGTNSQPLLLQDTAALCGPRAGRDGGDAADAADPTDLADLAEQLGRLVRKQASPMRSTSIASNYRRQVAAIAAQRLLQELCGTP
jgi:4-hydroxybenzoyl-CoA reductase subunit beta